MADTQDLDSGNGRQVSVVLTPSVISVIDAAAKRKHIARSTYLRQLIADHAIELLKQDEAA